MNHISSVKAGATGSLSTSAAALERHPCRRGHTLVELVVAITASSILLVGLGSALFVATQATSATGVATQLMDASTVAFEISEELRYAIFISERSEHAIEFAVADMDDDGQDDVIRYEWSGIEERALRRTFNRGKSRVVEEDVYAFDLDYRLRDKSEVFDGASLDSEDVVLSENTRGGSGIGVLSGGQWVGQCFSPSLPANATAWSVDSVELNLRSKDLATGQFLVQLRPATASGTPTSTVLEELLVKESTFGSSFSTQTYGFTSVQNLLPTERLCIVLEHVYGMTACEAQYNSGSVSLPDHALVVTGNYGASWLTGPTSGLAFRVQGDYYTPPETTHEVSRSYVTSVRLTLGLQADSQQEVRTNIPLVNTPEVLSGYWKLDFDADPTTVDANFDEISDWSDLSDGDSLGALSGVWYVDAENLTSFRTQPDHDLGGLTTLGLSCRCTNSDAGNAAECWAYVDRQGTECGAIGMTVTLEADGTQTATVYSLKSDLNMRQLAQVSGLDTEFVDFRLVVDPSADLAAIWVDGEYLITRNYDLVSVEDKPYFEISPTGTGAEYDYVSIRVGDEP